MNAMNLTTVLMATIVLGRVWAGSVAAQETPPAGEPAASPPAQSRPRAEDALVYVRLKTTAGDIVLELNREKAPVTVENFLRYVDRKFYDGTIFHRVRPDFVIQGGGYTEDMRPKPADPPIRNEAGNGLKNLAYTIAMARTADPDSATSQFFINVRDNPNLDRTASQPGYAVFGRVIEGREVVDRIKEGETIENPNMRGEKSLPVSPVKIVEARRLTEAEVATLKERLGQPSPGTPRAQP